MTLEQDAGSPASTTVREGDGPRRIPRPGTARERPRVPPVRGVPTLRRPEVTAAKAPSIRHTVIVADADPLARRVVRDALQDGTPFVVAAEAADGIEAVELVRHYRPDLLLIELSLPRLDGTTAIARIVAECPTVKIVVFSVRSDEDLEFAAIRAGAAGFVAKDAGTGAVVCAMSAVLSGQPVISPALTMRLVERLRATPDAGAGLRPVRSVLTTREWEVLDLLSAGATTAAIAERLVLAEDTIYSHVKNIMRKLGVHTRREAVEVAGVLLRAGGPSGAAGR